MIKGKERAVPSKKENEHSNALTSTYVRDSDDDSNESVTMDVDEDESILMGLQAEVAGNEDEDMEYDH